VSWLRNHGLVIVNVLLFLGFLIGMTLSGWHVSNDDALDHGDPVQSLGAYLASGDYWEAVSENWESEFMVVALLAGAAVFLRQRGSSESKPVHTPHSQTGD
jgi:hypothetical protein